MELSRFVPLVYLLSLNIFAVASAWIIAARLTGEKRGTDRLLAAFAIFSVLIVSSFEILGGIGKIGIIYLLILHMAILLIALCFGGTGGGASRRENPTGPAEPRGTLAMALVRGAFLILFVMLAAFALTMPPAPTDAFLDHLVFPAEWLHAGRITLVQTLSPDQATTYYPANGELMYLWLMLPLHDDLLAGLLEPACLLVSIIAAYSIGLKLGLRKEWAATSAAAAGLIPVTLNQMHQFGVDLFFTACFLCAVRFLLPDREGKRSIGETIVAGLAAGLAMGSKYFGLVLILTVIPFIFAAKAEKRKLVHTLVFFAALAAAGAYWYVRNLIVTGSPFYPLGFDVFGLTIFKGAYTRDAMFHSYLHTPISRLGLFGDILTGYSLGLSLLTATLLTITIGAARRVKDFRVSCVGIEWHKWYFFSLAPIFALLFWYVNPYNIANNSRFLIPGLFSFILLFGWTLQREKWASIWWLFVFGLMLDFAGVFPDFPKSIATTTFGFVHDSFNSLGGSGRLPDAFALYVVSVVTVILGLAAVASLINGRQIFAFASLTVFATVLCLCVLMKSDHMNNYRYRWYGGHYLASGWRAVSNIERPLKIAYAGNCSPYGLYGTGLKNRVEYINTDGRARWIFHNYERAYRTVEDYRPPRESTGLNYIFRQYADYGSWHERLIAKGIDVLFVSREFYRGRITTPVEGEWAIGHPDWFRPIFIKGDIFIFQVLKTKRTASGFIPR
jgi:hypothetical protein